MKYYDLHTHTIWSDGEGTVDDLQTAARAKNYGLGIADHLFCEKMFTAADIERYLNALDAYDVLKGGEANAGEDYSLPDAIASRFDYIIASVHAFPEIDGSRIKLSKYFGQRAGEDTIWDYRPQNAKPETYLEALLPIIEDTMRTQRMDIYGHSTVLPFCETLADTAFLRDWENTLIGLCKKYDIALEISGLWREPGLAMVERARKAGLRFSLGSDCHLLSDACNMEYAVDLVKKAGITPDEIFVPKK